MSKSDFLYFPDLLDAEKASLKFFWSDIEERLKETGGKVGSPHTRTLIDRWFDHIELSLKTHYAESITGAVWDDRNKRGFRGRAFRRLPPPKENA